MTFYEKNNDDPDGPEVLKKDEFTGECPYCKSKNVIKFGSSGVGASVGPNLPECSGEDWVCEDCKKIFTLI